MQNQHRRHRDTQQLEHIIQLTVLAKDRGFHQPSASIIESSKAKVIIRITPVNRHRPRISIKQHSTLPTTSFSTTQQRKPIFAVVHVSDQDLGIYGEICLFEIVSGNEANFFKVTNTSTSHDYNLELARSVSELSNSLLSTQLGLIKVIVKATDCGGKSSNETITISPESQFTFGFVFTSDNYHQEIRENSLIGTHIVQVNLKLVQSDFVTASVDIKNKDQFHFNIISGNDDVTFAISQNGVIYNLVKLDRESIAKYTLVVRAVHELNLVATTMVHIEVLDDNDNYPVFRNVSSDQVVQLAIAENRPNGSIIYRVEATDFDQGNNAYITYEFVHYGIDNQLPFAINSKSGDVFITEQLDYETLPITYHVFVRASDSGEPFRRQSQILLNITVLDVNDHRPQFLQHNCTAYVPVSQKPFTDVMKFNAVDLDQDSKIVYKMFTPEADKCFRLDEQTGMLELTCNLKKEVSRSPDKLTWTLTISATDGKYFSDPNYFKVIVVDQDILGSSSSNVHSPIRNECTVRYEDSIHDRLKSKTSPESNLLDDKIFSPEEKEAIEIMRESTEVPFNKAPILTHVLSEISIPENTPLGTKIATFTANDSDPGFAGLMIWSLNLQELNDKKIYFEVNQFTGELFLISELDYESEKIIPLLVTVCDQSLLNQKCVNQSVRIVLEDVNDNTPLLPNVFTFNISEAAPVHTVIGTIYATDEDSGDNSALEYFIESQSDSVFSIDLFNGTLRLEKPLDREEMAKYILYVTVSDSGTPVLTSTSTIIINVNGKLLLLLLLLYYIFNFLFVCIQQQM